MRRPDLSPTARRILYAVLFEAFGLVLTAAILHGTTHEGVGTSTGAAVGTTVLALVWNYVFNWFWERWEAKQAERGRSLGRRVAHAVLFEGGLVLLTVPFLVWWMNFGWLEGLVYDLGLTAVFAVYTFIYTCAFDKVFGLPDSAR